MEDLADYMNSCSQHWEKDRRGTRPESCLELKRADAGDRLDLASGGRVNLFSREDSVEPNRETKGRYLFDKPVMSGRDLC